ncbi:hypothetical protein Q8A73_012655 [Channa argus]|nr:hypothetical protein Q8A73_012655 [Channa argus]
MPINSSSSALSKLQTCSNSTGAGLMSKVCIFTNIFLLLPLSLHVLFLGLQRWWHQRSFATTSHSDILTYHSAAMELICVLGTSIHILTCVERYLAIVHPVIYVGLRQSRGVRIRNVSIGLSVLCVLIRPGPGNMGVNREQNYIDWCVVVASGNLVTLPSSSVLPLLFLHRAGKLVCCHCNNINTSSRLDSPSSLSTDVSSILQLVVKVQLPPHVRVSLNSSCRKHTNRKEEATDQTTDHVVQIGKDYSQSRS